MSSSRLQVLIPPGLDGRVRKAAQRLGISKGEWVRRALESALKTDVRAPDALARLSALAAPTADIDQMLAEIEAGRT
ncbi:MAG TPA: antitoxin [Vicinamibacteria bacterium]|nr:antitoxin [Vicinamibacteria bacterium]